MFPSNKETLMKIIDPDHPFYRPLWRRLAIVGVTLAWAGVEAWTGATGWAVFFVAVAAYAAWMLVANYKPKTEDTGDKS